MKTPTAPRLVCRILAVSALATACAAHPNDEEHAAIGSSGATCPSNSTLTYDGFGRDFMERYCTTCHSSALTGAARRDAPTGADFDSRKALREVGAEHIDLHAAAGPSRVNQVMPPDDFEAQPTNAERRQLGEWLACGMP